MANEFKVKNGIITPTLQSTVATGTAPLTVASTTLVSNLNADLLDGNHASDFASASHTHSYLPLAGGTMTGVITTPNGTHGIVIGDDSRLADRNVANTLFVEGAQNTDRGYINFSATSGNSLGAINGGALTWNSNTIWHAGNDGTGSGLDADTLDGNHASAFASASHTHPWSNITSTPTTLSGYGITDAEYKQPLNTARNNLGDPTIRDAALFHGQFNNKFRFIAPTSQEESADGTTWAASTRATTDQLKDLMIGEGQGTSFTAIPTGAIGTYGGYRLTWDVVSTVGYIFLNYLYFYNSTNGNSVNVLVEAYHNTNGWVTISGPNSFANWPGHTSVPHSSIPYSANASQYSKVRVTFSTTHNAYTNSFDLFGIEWFGGYPQGRRNVEYYDRNKNVFYPAVVNAVDFNSTSDARKKKDVAPVESGLDVLSKLSPVSFKWSETEAKSYGLIAQEVEKVLPELVHTNSDGFKSLAYIPLIAFLIDAVQDLSAEVQKLKSTN